MNGGGSRLRIEGVRKRKRQFLGRIWDLVVKTSEGFAVVDR